MNYVICTVRYLNGRMLATYCIEGLGMACNQQCLRFGELAVKMGFITPAQLEAALAIQQAENRANHHRLIGLILFDEGWVTTAQIEQVLQGVFLQPEAPTDRAVACRSR